MEWTHHLSLLEQHHTAGKHTGLTYNVVFRVLNVADYGVPQSRHRVVIVGFRNDLDVNWSFPTPTHTKEALLFAKHVDGSYWDQHRVADKYRSVASHSERERIIRQCELTGLKTRWQTVRDAIHDLPDPQNNLMPQNFHNHEFKAGARAYHGHSGSCMDEPSKTIKAGAHGVPGGENMIVLDGGALRYYTVRESARIQTFPDDYLFFSSWTESMRQIGNAVPVQFAKVIGKSVIDRLERASA